MAIGFSVEMNQFPDNVALATTAAAIEAWLDELEVPTNHTVYEVSIEHHAGFWVVIIIFEE